MITHRKIAWYLLTIVIIAGLLLVGCKPQTPAETPTVEEPPSLEDTPIVEEPPSPEEPPTEQAEEPLRIAFLYSGTVNDMGWAWQFDQARMVLEEKYGDRIETVNMEGVPFSEEASRIIEQLIADGASLIVDTAGFGELLLTVVEAHPEIKFITGAPAIVENQYQIYYHQGQISYLIGMAAGLMTETNHIGYIGSFDAPWIRTEINSYHLGARSVNPDVTTHVVNINAWWDPTANRQAAEALIDSGVDFLFTILNDPTTIVVGQERGVWACSSNGDQLSFGEDVYVTGRTVDWSPKLIEQIEKIFAGTWQGNVGEVDLAKLGSGLGLNTWGKNVPQDVIDQVEAMRDKMLNEGYNPLVGPIYDKQGNLVVGEGEELTDTDFALGGFEWTLEGVEGIE